METSELLVPRKTSRETEIENTIIDHPESLGYPDALALRNWRVAPCSGRCDVGLLPQNGPVRLVLVEAKVAKAPDAASRCVGQLIMYYAGALQLGSDGLEFLKAFARDHKKAIRDGTLPWISLRMLAGTKTNAEAWGSLSSGKSLEPREVRLFLAMDGGAPQSLVPVLNCLKDLHLLSIGLLVVRDGTIAPVTKPYER